MKTIRTGRGVAMAMALCAMDHNFAQNCAAPPGTVGIGTYCPKPKIKPLAAVVANAAPGQFSVPAPGTMSSSATELAAVTPAPSSGQIPSVPTVLAAAAAASTSQVTGATDKTAPAAPPPLPGMTNRTWSIFATDGKLATTFERWAKADGMKLVWDAKQHVILSSSDTFNGTLIDALNRVLGSPAIRLSAYPMEACIYPNVPPVLRITRLGDQTLECTP